MAIEQIHRLSRLCGLGTYTVISLGGHLGSALHASAYVGHDETVHLLLEEHANIDALGGKWDSTLIVASWLGSDDTVKALLQTHATVDLVGKRFGTALQAACYDGRKSVVDLLLDAGADVNLLVKIEEWFGTALRAAASSGFASIARKLIWRGVVVDARASKYGTAPIAAAANGKQEAVQLLLDEGADLYAEIQGKPYQNA